jgi:hypothetical protein
MKISVIVGAILFGLASCCGKADKLNNPPLPGHTEKWRKYQLAENTTVYGDFVLHKGESVDDGVYGIQAVELYAAKCDHRDVPGEDLPSAQLRFFKVSDNSTICDFTFKRGSALLDEKTCRTPNEIIWSVVEITDVNTEQEWVRFNLRLK